MCRISSWTVCAAISARVIAAVGCAVPIDDVYLMTVSPYDVDEYRVGGHDELILQQYEQWGVVCVTSAPTSATPNVTVAVAGSDVTELFARSVERRPVLLESGLTRQHVTVRLRYVTSQPEPEMNGKILTCTAASQPGFNDVSATAVLLVNCTCQSQCPRGKYDANIISFLLCAV